MQFIPRLFIPDALTAPLSLILSPAHAHYLVQVLRKQPGDKLRLFNGHDGEWEAGIVACAKKEVIVEVERQCRLQEKEADMWLIFAPVKNVHLPFIIEKATELGVSALKPILTAHSVVDKINMEKWEVYAREAAEQCERLTVPAISPLCNLTDILASWPNERKLLWCDESGGGEALRTCLPQLPKDAPYAMLIGPEGGFSRQEQDLLRTKPYVQAIHLGPRILRADTAALSALSCIQAMIGDWDKKPRFEQGGA